MKLTRSCIPVILIGAVSSIARADQPPPERSSLKTTGQSAQVSSGGCTHDIECDDGNPCTIDECDFPSGGPIGSGACVHTAAADGTDGGFGGPECIAAAGLLCGGCNDGLFCNGVESCMGGVCAPGTPPCSGAEVCSESLDYCQSGPCDPQLKCIDGPTPGINCATHFECGTGGRCAYPDCDDGLRCNGHEACMGGICTATENPCGHGADCSERRCSETGQVVFCESDADCSGVTANSTCTVLGPACKVGRCCSIGQEPLCSKRTLTSCSAGGGQFYASDEGSFSPGNICPLINGVVVRCPKYGSGIAPFGVVTRPAGPVSNSAVVDPSAGLALRRLGDDYTLSNSGVCVGGSRNGLACGNDASCTSGFCNLTGTSFLAVDFLRIVGAMFEGDRLVVEFRDEAGHLVDEQFVSAAGFVDFEVHPILFKPPVTIPSRGFVVVRVPAEYSPNGRFIWAATDSADVGANDPNVLWVNDGPAVNFLSPNPGVLMFELQGDKTPGPFGACCESDGSGCVDGALPWVCKGEGKVFLGTGTICPQPSCDTGACCDATTGQCSVGTDTECATTGGIFRGFGSHCDLNLCPQPSFTGADRCEDVTFHIITAPLPGESRTITITGDNSSATRQTGEPLCLAGGETTLTELGWYEGIDTMECTMLRVDYCGTEPVKRPVYHVLYDDCPCGPPIESTSNPYQFPQADRGEGAPFCYDQNSWMTFGPLGPGHYIIPVYSGIPGSFGPYQMHVTAQGCPDAACCVADQCAGVMNQLECDAAGGNWLGPPQKGTPVTTCVPGVCETGSCCAQSGGCVDIDPLGQLVTKAYCDSVGGTYTGGVRCKGGVCALGDPPISCSSWNECGANGPCLCNGVNCTSSMPETKQASPCPSCEIESNEYCQSFDDSIEFAFSDRQLGNSGILAADDFVPFADTLSQVCVWGFYYDIGFEPVDTDCGPAVAQDAFRVRLFANDPVTGRMPGALVGESMATSTRIALATSRIEAWTYVGSETYVHTLTLETPISGLILDGRTYWLEVSNDPTAFGPATCLWLWSQREQSLTSYSFTGDDDGYRAGWEKPLDFVFCLNMPMQPSTAGLLAGSCCRCDGACMEKTLSECDSVNGIWDVTRTNCDGVTCASGAPINDNCTDGPIDIVDGSYVLHTQCATTDGYGPIWTDFGPFQIEKDLWFRYVAPSNCKLTVGMCGTDERYDAALAVYYNTNLGDPAVCPPCPLDATTSNATLAGLGQDESCTVFAHGGAGVWRSMEQIGRPALAGECFLIRVGGYPVHSGTGILDVSCDPCIETGAPPCEGLITATRFLSIGCDMFRPCNPISRGDAAIRVRLTSLHHVDPPYTGGPSVPFSGFEGQIRWVGPPAQYAESSSNPTMFWASELQCEPYYRDWSDIPSLFVTGSAIVPSSIYHYEMLAASCMGSEATCTDVSVTVEGRTHRWGDVTAPFVPNGSQPDFNDIAALVDKFKSVPGALLKAQALLAGADIDGNISIVPDVGFGHIAACVDAFKGLPYPHTIANCP